MGRRRADRPTRGTPSRRSRSPRAVRDDLDFGSGFRDPRRRPRAALQRAVVRRLPQPGRDAARGLSSKNVTILSAVPGARSPGWGTVAAPSRGNSKIPPRLPEPVLIVLHKESSSAALGTSPRFHCDHSIRPEPQRAVRNRQFATEHPRTLRRGADRRDPRQCPIAAEALEVPGLPRDQGTRQQAPEWPARRVRLEGPDGEPRKSFVLAACAKELGLKVPGPPPVEPRDGQGLRPDEVPPRPGRQKGWPS